MAILTVRWISFLAMVSIVSIATPSEAATLFKVTEVGSEKYAWDKYPVNYTPNPKIEFGWFSGTGSGYYYQDSNGNLHQDIPVASNKYGSISYNIFFGRGSFQDAGIWYGGGAGVAWYVDGHGSPVHDFNIHGQVVGTIDGTEAMSSVTKNLPDPFLNHDISPKLGIHLTNATNIDDDGRILAQGTIGGKTHTYLLTPISLPAPAPEPSTILIMALGMTALSLRSGNLRRWWESATAT